MDNKEEKFEQDVQNETAAEETQEQFDEDGIMRYAGDVRYDEIIKNICESIELYEPHDYREQISKNMQLLVDGKGAERIVEMLYNI